MEFLVIRTAFPFGYLIAALAVLAAGVRVRYVADSTGRPTNR